MPRKIELTENERWAPIRKRTDFGKLLIGKGLGGTGVEIGTDKGVFAETILETSLLKYLFCVDPYLSGYDNGDPTSHGDREEDYRQALLRLQPWIEAGRTEIVVETSKEASEECPDGCLHFVYVDGCHKQESVKQDLELWWPKLASGGILAGHDIVNPNRKPDTGLGWEENIRPTVNQFAKSNGVIVYLVKDSSSNWSYYLEKP